MGRADERVFFHLPFQPQNPSSVVIQRLWGDLILSPPSDESLNLLKNWSNYPVPVKKLTIAYHQNPNLAYILSYRNLTQHTGLKASSFLPGMTWDEFALFFQSFAQRDGKSLKKWDTLSSVRAWKMRYFELEGLKNEVFWVGGAQYIRYLF
jgi:hypothetical protein